jgi:hypothetical protein
VFSFSLVSSLYTIIVVPPHVSATLAHTKPSRNAPNATLTTIKPMGQCHKQFTSIFPLFPISVQCLQIIPRQQKYSTSLNTKMTQQKYPIFLMALITVHSRRHSSQSVMKGSQCGSFLILATLHLGCPQMALVHSSVVPRLHGQSFYSIITSLIGISNSPPYYSDPISNYYIQYISRVLLLVFITCLLGAYPHNTNTTVILSLMVLVNSLSITSLPKSSFSSGT